MSYLHDEIDDEAPASAQHRELTLSTGSILGLFFGLALLCALFFGFGYSMGNRSHQAPIVAGTGQPADNTNFNTFKPAAGAPAGAQSSQPAYTPAPAPAPTAAAPSSVTVPLSSSEPATEAAPIVRSPNPANAVPPVATVASARPTPAADTPGAFVVQIAAVSHEEDADLLVNALKRKGYTVAAHTEPQDRLLHIQIGPFPTKKDAEAMRQRLLTDGYNAIVK